MLAAEKARQEAEEAEEEEDTDDEGEGEDGEDDDEEADFEDLDVSGTATCNAATPAGESEVDDAGSPPHKTKTEADASGRHSAPNNRREMISAAGQGDDHRPDRYPYPPLI